jgi:hypothetical protein
MAELAAGRWSLSTSPPVVMGPSGDLGDHDESGRTSRVCCRLGIEGQARGFEVTAISRRWSLQLRQLRASFQIARVRSVGFRLRPSIELSAVSGKGRINPRNTAIGTAGRIMGTAVRPAKTSPGQGDAFAAVDVFDDDVAAELQAMAKDGARPMRSGPEPPLAGAALRKAVMAIWCVYFCGMPRVFAGEAFAGPGMDRACRRDLA